jgi:hypothetical protein
MENGQHPRGGRWAWWRQEESAVFGVEADVMTMCFLSCRRRRRQMNFIERFSVLEWSDLLD